MLVQPLKDVKGWDFSYFVEREFWYCVLIGWTSSDFAFLHKNVPFLPFVTINYDFLQFLTEIPDLSFFFLFSIHFYGNWST